MKRLFYLAGFSILLLFGCHKNEDQDFQELANEEFQISNSRTGERLFKGRVSGAAPTPMHESCEIGETIAGTFIGRTFHFGRTLVEYTGCASPFFPNIPENIRSRFVVEGKYVFPPFQDTLVIFMNVSSTPIERNPRYSSLEGEYTIAGGSGRFEHATGYGDIRGRTFRNRRHPHNIGFTMVYDGNIVY